MLSIKGAQVFGKHIKMIENKEGLALVRDTFFSTKHIF